MKTVEKFRIVGGLSVVLLGVNCSVALSAEEPLKTVRTRTVDITHIRLDFDVSLKQKQIAGTATLDFKPLRTVEQLELDAVGHETQSVERVSSSGEHRKDVRFQNTGQQLVITFSEPLERDSKQRIVIRYRVREPRSGLHFFGPTESEPDVPWMLWSQGEPVANRYWFPCIDHPNERQTTELVATVDSGFEVLSNGSLISREESRDGKRTRFHWLQDKPHVSYLVTLVVGQFAVGREEWRGKPVLYYVPEDRADDIERTFGRTREMLDFFSDRFGIEYPWDKYAQVVVEQFIIGGMENTSATTLTETVLHDERAMLDSSPDWLIAHELGHQWWGDLLTCKDWSHLWLNEGFATYCEVLWAEHKLGRDERDYRLYQKSIRARSGNAQKRPVVDRRYPSPSDMFDVRAYPKGGWVLHMLRHRLGDDDFFLALKRYGSLYAHRTVETTDLRQTFEQLTGRSLERFFYDWTERPGHPVLAIESKYDAESGLVRVNVKQEQKGEAFAFPLKIELTGADSAHSISIDKVINSKEQTLYLPATSRPKSIRIDPEFTLLAEIKEKKDRDWWEVQLESAPSVPERIRAAKHFGESKSEADRERLIKSLNSDPFHGVQVEVAAALGKSGGDSSRDALIAALTHANPKVRKGCITALQQFEHDEKVVAALRERVAQGDESYFVEGALLQSLAKVEPPTDINIFVAALEKDSHRETIRRAALAALENAEGANALDVLVEWSHHGKPRRCRTAAMATIAKYVDRNEVEGARRAELVRMVSDYLREDNPVVRRAAVGALRSLGSGKPPAISALEQLAERDANGRVRRAARDAVEKMRADSLPKQELKQLRTELDAVRKRNRELENRLEKLETR